MSIKLNAGSDTTSEWSPSSGIKLSASCIDKYDVDLDPGMEGFIKDLLDGFPLISAFLEWNDHTEEHIRSVIDKIISEVKSTNTKSGDKLPILDGVSSKYLPNKGEFYKILDGVEKMTLYMYEHVTNKNKIAKFKLGECYKFIQHTSLYNNKVAQKIDAFDAGDNIAKLDDKTDWTKLLLLFGPFGAAARVSVASGDNKPLSRKGWVTKTDIINGLNKVRQLVVTKDIMSKLEEMTDEDFCGDAAGLLEKENEIKHRDFSDSDYAYLVAKMCPKISEKLLRQVGYICRGMCVAGYKAASKSALQAAGRAIKEE